MVKLKTLNMDIASLCNRMRKFVEEGLKSASANTESINEFDIKRMQDHLAAAVNYKNFFISLPQIDCPETHPLELEVEVHEMSEIEAIENESIKDYCRLMWVEQNELLNSQSSRMATGLISHDNLRFDAIVTNKIERLIVDYILVTLPLDLPESSPAVAGVKPGLTGINQK